jgi:uncharacterized OB-fold protein
LPDPSHPDFRTFWDGCQKGKLLIPRCRNGHLIWPPRPLCRNCAADIVEHVELAPRGRLYSWTVVHRTRLSGYAQLTPYLVAIVELDDDTSVRMVGRGLFDAADAEVGRHVSVSFERINGRVTMPMWRLANRLPEHDEGESA